MFWRSKKSSGEPELPLTESYSAMASTGAPIRRHGRRGMRSSMTGPQLPNPASRTSRFETDARGAVQLLQHHLGPELDGVHIGFSTAPLGNANSEKPMFYSINRRHKTIIMYRMPIQRARGLHVDDADHRRFFVEHCVHRAVCEYLGKSPWEILPGRFDHY